MNKKDTLKESHKEILRTYKSILPPILGYWAENDGLYILCNFKSPSIQSDKIVYKISVNDNMPIASRLVGVRNIRIETDSIV